MKSVSDSVNVNGKNSESGLQVKEGDEEKGSSVASSAEEKTVSDNFGNVDKGLDKNSPVISSPDSKSEAKSLISAVSSNATKTTSANSGTFSIY